MVSVWIAFDLQTGEKVSADHLRSGHSSDHFTVGIWGFGKGLPPCSMKAFFHLRE
jgi:hypothetical protein